MRPLLLAPAALIAMASCGTLVQVVDARGTPVSGVEVQLIYPSFNGPGGTTDSDGYFRLSDSWFSRPLFSMMPAWVWVRTDAAKWSFDYPPPPVLRLDEGHFEQLIQRPSNTHKAP